MAVLANIFWRALTGSQAHLGEGTERIRRFRRGFPAMIGYADPGAPDFAALAPLCERGERYYCAEWTGPEPPGWKLEVDALMCAMAWQGHLPSPDPSVPIVRLAERHVAEMLAIADRCKPGPFARKPMEIGEWYGILDGDRVVAIAGERLHAQPYREVSGICTLPEYQGRGYARRLTQHVIRSQVARGLTPFLHVASANTAARKLYEAMGFVVDQEVAMRVVSLR